MAAWLASDGNYIVSRHNSRSKAINGESNVSDRQADFKGAPRSAFRASRRSARPTIGGSPHSATRCGAFLPSARRRPAPPASRRSSTRRCSPSRARKPASRYRRLSCRPAFAAAAQRRRTGRSHGQERTVERRQSAADRRRVVLSLTPSAERVLHALSADHIRELRHSAPVLDGLFEVLKPRGAGARRKD